VVALFGDSDATLWRPWGVPQRVLQAASRDVVDVSVADVRAAFTALARETGLGR
jgi:heptosyltransferase III